MAFFSFIDLTEVVGGMVLGISKIVVTPPGPESHAWHKRCTRYFKGLSGQVKLFPVVFESGNGCVLRDAGRHDEAIEQLRRAVLVARNNLDYRFELGRMYFNRGVTQPSINQEAFERITEDDITPEGERSTSSIEAISVEPTVPSGDTVTKNQDLQLAEQLFLGIVAANPNHANALYSLAVLYKKVGETENTTTAVTALLKILRDQQSINAVQQQFAEYIQ